MEPAARVTKLWVYPIKSCAGMRIKEARTDECGFRYDRNWMVVNPEGTFLTQRENPTMALIVPVIDESAGLLRVTAPGMDELTVSLSSDANGPVRAVTVFKVNMEGFDEGDEAAKWFSAYLKGEYRLVRKAPARRQLIEKYMPDENAFSYPTQTAFADNWPFLIAAEESVADVQTRTPEGAKLPTMRNFRPNIVVKGGAAFAEDKWKKVRIGDALFYVVAHCTRCRLTAVDPELGEAGMTTLKTLQSYRRIDKGAPYEACFGVHAVHAEKEVIVREGDAITVLETGVHSR